MIFIDIPEDTIEVDVSVYDSMGQKEYSNNNKKQINLAKVIDGIYFIEVKTTGKKYNGKIMKNE